MISNLQSTQPFFFRVVVLLLAYTLHTHKHSKFLLLYCIFFGRVEFEVWEKGCSNFRIIGTKKFYLWLNMLRATRKHTFFWYLNNGLFLQKKIRISKIQNLFENYSKKIIKISKPNTFGHPWWLLLLLLHFFLSKPAFNSLFAIFIFIFLVAL